MPPKKNGRRDAAKARHAQKRALGDVTPGTGCSVLDGVLDGPIWSPDRSARAAEAAEDAEDDKAMLADVVFKQRRWARISDQYGKEFSRVPRSAADAVVQAVNAKRSTRHRDTDRMRAAEAAIEGKAAQAYRLGAVAFLV